MADPRVIEVIRQFQADLLRREHIQMVRMASRYGQLEQKLEAKIDALITELDKLKANGEPVGLSRIYELRRYHLLLAQLQQEMAWYTDYAADSITSMQKVAGRIGLDQGAKAIKAIVQAHFAILPPEAIEAMTGLTSAGSPLETLLRNAYPVAAVHMTDALIEAVALGYNPNKAARNMLAGARSGLHHCLRIARTEQLRVYREAARRQYEASGLVVSYRRLSAHQLRTCIACLVDEGKVYSVNEPLPDHPNGRCTLVPIVIGRPALEYERGEQWFARQDESTQQRIMGQGAFDLWRGGRVGWNDLAVTRIDLTWGATVVPRPLRSLKTLAATH